MKTSFFIFVSVLLSSGCAPVQPWEKEFIARNHMSFVPDPLEAKSRQHASISKEASFGGYGAAGGGCGCN